MSAPLVPLALLPLFALALEPVHSAPLVHAATPREALASAHCAVLHVDAHPRGHLALAARICLRPGDEHVVEERGVVDLGARRFMFVRAPFREPATSWDGEDACGDSARGASDAVSRALRGGRDVARCMFDRGARGTEGAHALWSWRAGDVAWSGSGRLVALHRETDSQPEAAILDVESDVLDTSTLAAVHERFVHVPRFRGDTAEVFVAGRWPSACRVDSWRALLLEDAACAFARGDRPVAIQAALVDFADADVAARGPRLVRLGARFFVDPFEHAPAFTLCGGDERAFVGNVEPTTFVGAFDVAACTRAARRSQRDAAR